MQKRNYMGFLRSRIQMMRFEEIRAEKRKDPLLPTEGILAKMKGVEREMHLDSLRTSAQGLLVLGQMPVDSAPKVAS